MDILVVAPHFLPEIRMLPESKMSHSVALVQKYLGYYSGVDVILASRHHIDVCRLPLTQNLGELRPNQWCLPFRLIVWQITSSHECTKLTSNQEPNFSSDFLSQVSSR